MLKSGVNQNGRTYFPVAELAGEFGYAIDHISRLCRQGRVDAIQERNGYWYATRESILEYRDFAGAGKIKRRIALSNLGLEEQNRPPVLSTSSFQTADRAGEEIRYGASFRLSPKLAWQELIFQARKTWADRANLRPAALIAAKGFKAGFRYALLALFVLAVSSLTSAVNEEIKPMFNDIKQLALDGRTLYDNAATGFIDIADDLARNVGVNVNNFTAVSSAVVSDFAVAAPVVANAYVQKSASDIWNYTLRSAEAAVHNVKDATLYFGAAAHYSAYYAGVAVFNVAAGAVSGFVDVVNVGVNLGIDLVNANRVLARVGSNLFAGLARLGADFGLDVASDISRQTVFVGRQLSPFVPDVVNKKHVFKVRNIFVAFKLPVTYPALVFNPGAKTQIAARTVTKGKSVTERSLARIFKPAPLLPEAERLTHISLPKPGWISGLTASLRAPSQPRLVFRPIPPGRPTPLLLPVPANRSSVRSFRLTFFPFRFSAFKAAALDAAGATRGLADLSNRLFVRLPLAAGEAFGKNFVAVSNASSLAQARIYELAAVKGFFPLADRAYTQANFLSGALSEKLQSVFSPAKLKQFAIRLLWPFGGPAADSEKLAQKLNDLERQLKDAIRQQPAVSLTREKQVIIQTKFGQQTITEKKIAVIPAGVETRLLAVEDFVRTSAVRFDEISDRFQFTPTILIPPSSSVNAGITSVGGSTVTVEGGTVRAYTLLTVTGTGSITGDLTVGGSSAVAGNLAVDTSTLFIDSTNNRAGVGTISPETTFEVVGIASASSVFAGIGSVASPSFSFGNDKNTGLYRKAADSLSVSVGGLERLNLTSATASVSNAFYINSSGNIGIGTTSPTTQLDVVGSGSFSGALSVRRSPAVPHTGSWPSFSGTSDATLYINPSVVVADGNLIVAAVAGVPKFVVDAEGDIFANNVILTGTTVLGTTDVSGNLTVEGNTQLGDASTDTIKLVGAIVPYSLTSFPLLIKASASQTADLFRITDFANSILLTIDQAKGFFISSAGFNFAAAGAASVSYSRLGAGATGYSNWISAGNDLLVSGDLEVDASAQFDSILRVGASTLYVNPTTGNVGIGTSNLETKFEVAGAASVSGDLRVGGNLDIANSPTSYIYTSGGDRLKLSGNVTVSNSLKVGADAAPFYNLDVNGSFYTNNFAYLAVGAGNVGIGEVSPGSKLSVYGGLSVGADTAYSQISPPTDGMIIKGNVGIGTTVPTTKLDVIGNASVSLNFEIGNNLIAGGTGVFSGTGSSSFAGSLDITKGLNVNSGTLRVTTNGNVGIGTTVPGAKLDVWGTAGANDIFNLASSSGTSVLRVTKAGNVGIGTTLIIGNTGNDVYLARSTGTNGGRLWLGPYGANEATQSSQLDLVPGASCNSAAEICSQLQWFNNTGDNLERFAISAVNNQYIIDSTKSGSGVERNIYFRIGATNNLYLAGNSTYMNMDEGYVYMGGAGAGGRKLNIGALTGVSASIGYFEATVEKWAVGHDADADAFVWYNPTTGHYTLKMPDATDNVILYGNLGIGEVSPGSKLSVYGGLSVGADTAYSQISPPTDGMIIKGNVGIGTTSPAGTLAILSTSTISPVASISALSLTTGSVFNVKVPASSSFSGQILLVKDINNLVLASLSSGGRFSLRREIFSHGAVSNCTGVGTPTSGCVDLAEEFPVSVADTDKTGPISAGDLIALAADDAAVASVKKADSPYDKNIIGIATTRPGIILTEESVFIGANAQTYKWAENKVAVALAGRVPVRVSIENGAVKKGDYLTSSSKPGVAMKATKQGRVVGIALEGLKKNEALIMAFINPHWAGEELDINGQLAILGSASYNSNGLLKTSGGLFDIDILFASIVQRFEKVFNIVFKDGLIKVASIITDSLTAKNVSTNSLEIKDRVTGEIYCVRIANGDWEKTKGACDELVSAPAPEATPTPASQGAPLQTPEPMPTSSESPMPIPGESPTTGPETNPADEPGGLPSGSPSPSPDGGATSGGAGSTSDNLGNGGAAAPETAAPSEPPAPVPEPPSVLEAPAPAPESNSAPAG